MYSLTDSALILSEKIAKPLMAKVANEGLSLSIEQMKDKKIIACLASLLQNTDGEYFALDIYNGDSVVCEVYRSSCSSDCYRFTLAQTPDTFTLSKYGDSASIPCGMPGYLHPLVLAIVAYWL